LKVGGAIKGLGGSMEEMAGDMGTCFMPKMLLNFFSDSVKIIFQGFRPIQGTLYPLFLGAQIPQIHKPS